MFLLVLQVVFEGFLREEVQAQSVEFGLLQFKKLIFWNVLNIFYMQDTIYCPQQGFQETKTQYLAIKRLYSLRKNYASVCKYLIT